MSGRSPVTRRNEIRSVSSAFVPIVEPSTRSCRKNTRFRSADGVAPDVAPDIDDDARPA